MDRRASAANLPLFRQASWAAAAPLAAKAAIRTAALAWFLFASVARAQEPAFVVTAPSATIYTAPSESSTPAGKLMRGKSLRSNGQRQNGFVGLSTKSGRKLWAKESDLRASDPELSLDDDLEKAPASPRAFARESENDTGRRPAARDWSLRFPPVATFDLGASTGNYSVGRSSYSYTEFNLGLNLFFAEWFAWRNALWSRFASGVDTFYGLDTSVRGILNIGDSSLGLTAFAGPGWRFPSQGDGSPFVEAGLIFNLKTVALGGGVRSFLHSWVTSGAPNETQYFLIVSGGGRL